MVAQGAPCATNSGRGGEFGELVAQLPQVAGGDLADFSWINWKDQAAHDAGWEKIMADPRMAEFSPATAGADMGRMIYGTFRPLVVA